MTIRDCSGSLHILLPEPANESDRTVVSWKKPESVSVPFQYLDSVSCLVAEHEQWFRERIKRETFAYHDCQSVDRFSHVCRSAADVFRFVAPLNPPLWYRSTYLSCLDQAIICWIPEFVLPVEVCIPSYPSGLTETFDSITTTLAFLYDLYPLCCPEFRGDFTRIHSNHYPSGWISVFQLFTLFTLITLFQPLLSDWTTFHFIVTGDRIVDAYGSGIQISF